MASCLGAASSPEVRILHVIPSLAEAHGGPTRALRSIEKALIKKDILVEIATTNDDGKGGKYKGIVGRRIDDFGVITLFFRKTMNAYKVSIGFARWVLIGVGDYDLVHVHALFSFTSVVAAWAARRAHVPYVLRPLGTLGSYGLTQRRPWLKRLSLRLVEGPLLRHAAAVHFTSSSERIEAELLGIPMKSVVIPLAIEQVVPESRSTFDIRFPELVDGQFVLFLSRLHPVKNIEGLLNAIALSSKTFPEVLWFLAGDGEPAYVASLKACASRLGISDRVVWAGHVDGEIKANALARAELFVLPSFSENFGLAAVEALQAGLPVILGKGVALAQVVTEHGAGIAVEPTPEAIAGALSGYLSDPEARTRASENARVLADREYSLDTLGARLVGLYETILKAPDRKWPGASGDD